MSNSELIGSLITVDQAATLLNLHPKTVLRYIRNGQLQAARMGKSYRITRAQLDAFMGITKAEPSTATSAKATCVIDIPNISAENAEKTATFLQSAAAAGVRYKSQLHLETIFDPSANCLKVMVIGSPPDVAALLEMLHIQGKANS